MNLLLSGFTYDVYIQSCLVVITSHKNTSTNLTASLVMNLSDRHYSKTILCVSKCHNMLSLETEIDLILEITSSIWK